MLSNPDHQKLLCEHGKHGYHVTEAANLESIREQGIVPADQLGFSVDSGVLTPRPGHVYLLTAAGAQNYMADGQLTSEKVMLRVSLADIDAQRINPDEDAFWCYTGSNGAWPSQPLAAEAFGLENPFDAVYDPHWHDLCGPRTVQQRFASYGQWADAVDLGTNSSMTLQAIEHSLTLAVRGIIAPEVILPGQLQALPAPGTAIRR